MDKFKNETPSEILQLGAFLSNFNKESDRGATLSAAAVLEDRLEEIIKTFLQDCKSSVRLLDGFNAPIGTFSSKILLAHALGLIQDDEFQQIELLRKIRNNFAHTWEYLDFKSDSIKCLVFTLPYMGPRDIEQKCRDEPRQYFNFWVSGILVNLLWRKNFVDKEKRSSKDYLQLYKGDSNMV
ncbi:transcriptional regulator [Acinetobacter seifertii]|uniref:transcriptional regulator n=1 Tax=Acinetobacter seifertii TaxID=1530123 RepID=UPI003AF93C17